MASNNECRNHFNIIHYLVRPVTNIKKTFTCQGCKKNAFNISFRKYNALLLRKDIIINENEQLNAHLKIKGNHMNINNTQISAND